jgi:hypothetical protein
MKASFRLIVVLGISMLMALVLSGCFGDSLSGQPEDGQPADTTGAKSRKTTAMYYDFEDVLIPMELKVVSDRTVVVTTPGYTSGIITLKGRVERRSLFNFFNSNMQKDNWGVVSQIKSPGTTIMVFQKTSRTAVITIRDEQINTWVEVGIAPTVGMNSGFNESAIME